MITMADVARVAGVSISTVSHVVNGTRKVSLETERAVRDALQATGYTHDRIARSLATGRTRTIGLAMSAISNPYFAELAHAIEREAARDGYTLLLADTHDDPERELRAISGRTAPRARATADGTRRHEQPHDDWRDACATGGEAQGPGGRRSGGVRRLRVG